MEKKIAPRPPSFIRGMSMLPSAFRAPKSNLASKKRCVVSSCVSITMEEKWSCFARSEIPSTAIALASAIPAEKHIPAQRSAFDTPDTFILLLSGPHFAAHDFVLFHHTQQVAAEDLPKIVIAVALAHQSFRNLWEMSDVIHALGHISSVEIRTKSDVIRSHQFNDMIDVVDDSFPAYVRQLAFRSGFFRHLGHLFVQTLVIVAALFFELVHHLYYAAGKLVLRVFVGLIDETFFVVDLNHAALRGQRFNHVVGHIAHVIAKRAARRVRRN